MSVASTSPRILNNALAKHLWSPARLLVPLNASFWKTEEAYRMPLCLCVFILAPKSHITYGLPYTTFFCLTSCIILARFTHPPPPWTSSKRLWYKLCLLEMHTYSLQELWPLSKWHILQELYAQLRKRLCCRRQNKNQKTDLAPNQ